MNRAGGQSSLKMGLMALAAVASVGVGVVRTASALRVGAPPARQASAPTVSEAPAAENAGGGASSSAPGPAARVVEAPAALTEAPVSTPKASEVDPFIPLPPASAPPVAVAPVTRPALPGVGEGGEGAPTPPELPGPEQGPQVGVRPRGEQNPAVAAPASPVLLGTLLGHRSSAVFQIEGVARAVPAGSTLAGWKVVSVEHGRVTLAGYGVRRTLILGAAESAESAPAPPQGPPAPVR